MNSETTARNAARADKKAKKADGNGASHHGKLNETQLLDIYRKLIFTRFLDMTLYDLKKKGRITRGEIYSCRGQEAVIVGTLQPLLPADYISPIHRDLPAFALKGMELKEVMAQVFGKYTAPGKAKDVWTHFGDLSRGIIHSTSMLASTIPVACGVALSLVMNGSDLVVVAYSGDGATARGDFHEGLNFAAVHKLPLIVVVENNQWAYSTPVTEGCPVPHFADRAKGFGIPGITVDGQNVLEVIKTMDEMTQRARKGEGPSVIECVTYRLLGHASHDDTKAMQYRPKNQQEQWGSKDKDPIQIFREYLIKTGMSQDDLPLEPPADMQEEMREAIQFAIDSPTAPSWESMEDIYDESAGVSL